MIRNQEEIKTDRQRDEWKKNTRFWNAMSWWCSVLKCKFGEILINICMCSMVVNSMSFFCVWMCLGVVKVLPFSLRAPHQGVVFYAPIVHVMCIIYACVFVCDVYVGCVWRVHCWGRVDIWRAFFFQSFSMWICRYCCVLHRLHARDLVFGDIFGVQIGEFSSIFGKTKN